LGNVWECVVGSFSGSWRAVSPTNVFPNICNTPHLANIIPPAGVLALLAPSISRDPAQASSEGQEQPSSSNSTDSSSSSSSQGTSSGTPPSAKTQTEQPASPSTPLQDTPSPLLKPEATNRKSSTQELELSDQEAKALLDAEEEKRKQRRRQKKGRIRELEEVGGQAQICQSRENLNLQCNFRLSRSMYACLITYKWKEH